MTDGDAPVTVANPAREMLARGELVTALSVRLARTVEIVGIARSAGFASLYVDLEHCSITDDAAAQICTAALNLGLPPFVRVRANTAEHITSALDGGALGVIVPQIRSAEDVRAAVSHARFPPDGTRSVSSAMPQFEFRPVPVTQAVPALNAATMVIAMLETVEALEAIDDLAATPGLDMLLIGGNDLTSELGVPGDYGHPTARDAYRRVIQACRRHGCYAGVAGIGGQPELLQELVDEGVRFISVGTDLNLLMKAATEATRSAPTVRS